MMTHDEMIAVIQAHKEGKKIQWRQIGQETSPWIEIVNPSWSFFTTDYRIAPEPRVIWVNECKDYPIVDSCQSIYASKDLAVLRGSEYKSYLRTIKFVEVIE